jgi:hypothetical protein
MASVTHNFTIHDKQYYQRKQEWPAGECEVSNGVRAIERLSKTENSLRGSVKLEAEQKTLTSTATVDHTI